MYRLMLEELCNPTILYKNDMVREALLREIHIPIHCYGNVLHSKTSTLLQEGGLFHVPKYKRLWLHYRWYFDLTFSLGFKDVMSSFLSSSFSIW